MKASDIMTRRVIKISSDATVLDAVHSMMKHRISGLPVVDADGELIGIVSEGNFLRRPETGTERKKSSWLAALFEPKESARSYVHSHGIKVQEVMTTNPITVEENAPLDEVVHLMEIHRVKRLPVMQRGKIVGIISRANLVRALASVHNTIPTTAKSDATIRDRILAEIDKQGVCRQGLPDRLSHRPSRQLLLGALAMRSSSCASDVKPVSSYFKALRLLTTAACLWPAFAVAQPPNPTASDANGNTAAGTDALLVVSGINNTAIGLSALRSNTTGNNNTASGKQVLFFNTTGSSNTASGVVALAFNSTGSQNTASGFKALYLNTTGGDNTASGANALTNNTTGTSNTASGVSALNSNTTGYFNTASGVYTLYSNTIGSSNTASGVSALYANTTGSNNIANGASALASNTTGSNNIASGYRALVDNITGNFNTAIGDRALSNNANGRNNTAVGAGALFKINGTNNIALGTSAGASTTSGNSNIYIGHQGRNGSENKVIRIGQAQTRTFVAGIAGVALSGAAVVVTSNGQLGVVASSARYKQDIRTLSDASNKLAQLRPVSYRYKTEPEATHYGLIAEEVDKVMPELVVRDEQNRPESVQYQELVPLLLHQWTAQQAKIARQEAEIIKQREVNATLERRLAALEATLSQSPRREATIR